MVTSKKDIVFERCKVYSQDLDAEVHGANLIKMVTSDAYNGVMWWCEMMILTKHAL